MPARQYDPPGRAIGIAKIVGRLIADARKRKDWTQFDLGEVVGCHQVTIARWETGAVPINVVDLVLTAEQLDCAPASLLPGGETASADALLAAAADVEALASSLRARAEAYDRSEAASGA